MESLIAVDVVSEATIRAPLKEVAGFVANPDNAPKWYVNIKSVEWETSPPLTIGSKIAFVAHFLGRRLAYTYEIVEYEPDAKMVMRTAEGPFPMETTYQWRSIEENVTHMTLRNRGAPAGFSKIFAPFMTPAIRRANRKDLMVLKRLLEKPVENHDGDDVEDSAEPVTA